MNKAQLVEKMADRAAVSKVEARKSLDAFLDVITEELSGGGKVTLVGFGTFVVERQQPRLGRDPRNGAQIKIAAKNVVKFRPGQELNEVIQ